jgi:hypothetical protein
MYSVYIFHRNNTETVLHSLSPQKTYDVHTYRKKIVSLVSDGVDVIAMVPKEARGVILWTTGQVILDHTFVPHQEG